MYNVLIVDDEKIVRDGISKYMPGMDTRLSRIDVACDGEQALEKCYEFFPDILITDINMPKRNGIELIKAVKEIDSNILVVVISGYDDFEYAQSAVRLGVTDYILKPFLPNKVEIVIKDIIKKIESREKYFKNIENLKKKVDESGLILRGNIMNSLNCNKLTTEDIYRKVKEMNVSFDANYYSVAMVKTNQLEVDEEIVSQEKVRINFLVAYLEQNIDDKIRSYAFTTQGTSLGIILGLSNVKTKEEAEKKVDLFLLKLVKSLLKHYSIQLIVSHSHFYQDVLRLDNAYNEAKEGLIYRDLFEFGKVIHYRKISEARKTIHSTPTKQIEALLLNIRAGNKEDAQNLVCAILAYYKEKLISFSYVKKDIIELVVRIIRYYDEKIVAREAGEKERNNPYAVIQRISDFDALRLYLEDLVEAVINEIELSRKNSEDVASEKLKEIARTNISNEKFTLDDAARLLYVSPNHLRQLFKRSTGKTFLEYMISLRMEKAKYLLLNHEDKIHEIASKVGYVDQRYFSKAFKKFSGSTPTKYREKSGEL